MHHDPLSLSPPRVSYPLAFVEKQLGEEQLLVLDIVFAGNHVIDVRGIADETTSVQKALLIASNERIVVLNEMRRSAAVMMGERYFQAVIWPTGIFSAENDASRCERFEFVQDKLRLLAEDDVVGISVEQHFGLVIFVASEILSENLHVLSILGLRLIKAINLKNRVQKESVRDRIIGLHTTSYLYP